jgi:hypothetical protein
MSVIADLFPEFAAHRIPTGDAAIFVRTVGSGPPLVLHGFPQTHACEDYRVGASSDLELDDADLAAGRKLACPTFVLWGSAYLGGPNRIEAWPAWCTTVSGVAVKAKHSLAEEKPQAWLAALVPFLKAHAGSDGCCHQVLLG